MIYGACMIYSSGLKDTVLDKYRVIGNSLPKNLKEVGEINREVDEIMRKKYIDVFDVKVISYHLLEDE